MSNNYDESTKEEVWRKAEPIPGYDPNIWRKDKCGAIIKFSDHGNRDSKNGWEIDHIDPDCPDMLSNYQPLQWENNVAKSDNGRLKCVVTS